MAVNACPGDDVLAPVESVWSLMSRASGLDSWWEAKLLQAPEGALVKGMRLSGRGGSGPIQPKVFFEVEEVDPARHRLILQVALPFGIRNRAVVTASPRGPERCFVQFG